MTGGPVDGRLGATVVDGSTRFEVWAPGASLVEVGVQRAHDTDDGDSAVAGAQNYPIHGLNVGHQPSLVSG